ncbi:hypothetical protein RAS2_23280 [Phycisphaerae bacterium RAS2]|nr:hypothetical protein RAS2_23280 [Phycisphaerae bacterium RAS2]
MQDSTTQPPLFYPSIFAKTLIVVVVAAVIGCAVAYRIYDELALRDIIGTAISGTLAAYLIHLWIGLSRPERREQDD